MVHFLHNCTLRHFILNVNLTLNTALQATPNLTFGKEILHYDSGILLSVANKSTRDNFACGKPIGVAILQMHSSPAVRYGADNIIMMYSSTCHDRTPSGPGKSVRTLQVAARHRGGWASGGRQIQYTLQ